MIYKDRAEAIPSHFSDRPNSILKLSMGKKLDALLGRNFRASKFRSLVNLAFSRIAILKNQRHVRCSLARSDVLQLLQLGYHQRALLRVELVIKEQNLLDAYVVIEGYLNLLIERINLLEQERECPDELKEAISGLLFAASRCGDFPELQEIKSALTSRFGKEFTARAVELRNNCGVNHLIMQKLSTRQPSLESRMNVLKAIASENGIALQLDEAPIPNQEKMAGNKRQNQPEPHAEVGENLQTVPEQMVEDEGPSGSMQARQKYKDVADAAQAAFESAAQAAAAARAAVELSRSESQDPDDPSSPSPSFKSPYDSQEQKKAEVESKMNEEIQHQTGMRDAKTSESTAAVKNAMPTSSRSDLPCDKESQLHKQRPSNLQTGLDMETKPEHTTQSADEISQKPSFRLDLGKKPMSVRTRRVRGY